MTEVPQTTRVPQWTLGDRLKKAREHAGYTQAELAAVTGIGRSTMVTYETDRAVPKRPILLSWHMATGVPLEWIISGEDRPSGPDNGTSAQFRGGEVNVPKNINPWSQWGSPTPLTLAVAA